MGSTGAVGWVVGLFVPRPSVLRRRSDRVEVAARWVLLVVGLVLVPVACSVGSGVTAGLAPRVAEEQAQRREVSAVVLADPAYHVAADGEIVTGEVQAPVRWVAGDGTVREALVRVPEWARPGDPRVLWVDAHERPTGAPLTPGDATTRGVLAAVTLVLTDIALSLFLLAGLRWLLDRVRLREWDAAWRRFTGPDQESRR